MLLKRSQFLVLSLLQWNMAFRSWEDYNTNYKWWEYSLQGPPIFTVTKNASNYFNQTWAYLDKEMQHYLLLHSQRICDNWRIFDYPYSYGWKLNRPYDSSDMQFQAPKTCRWYSIWHLQWSSKTMMARPADFNHLILRRLIKYASVMQDMSEWREYMM